VRAQGAQEDAEHVVLALAVVGLERDDVPGGVVEQRVNPQRLGGLPDAQRRAVADIAVPERTRVLGLPPQARVAIGPHTAGQLRLAVETLHRRRRDGAFGEPTVSDECADDQRHRRGRVLAADIEEEIPLIGRQLAGAAAVRSRRRSERLEAAAAIRVEPALDRREAELLADLAAGWPVLAGGDGAERERELSARQLALDDRAHDG